CAYEVLDLTITPTTYNSTSVSACDSYTWAVNSQSYTASGSYTAQVGACAYEVLDLTITPTTYNSTSVSACDSYTWSVNSQSYTASGSYTAQVGACAYEVLDLTITGISSVAPTGANASSASICLGNSVTLSVAGGSLGTGASWVWYEGGCGTGSPIGTGASITITPGSFGLISYFVRAEGTCNTTACATVDVDVVSPSQLPTVSILSGPDAACIGNTAVVTATTVPGATGYNWTVGPGVLINGQPSPYTSTSTSVTLTFTALPSGGNSGWNICVQATNGCGVSPNIKCLWIRATLSVPGAISGSLTACPNTSGTYTIAPMAGAVSYVWTSSSPSVSVSGTGTSAMVNFGPGFTGGNICVAGVTSCGYVGPTRCINLSVAPGIPGTISGPASICPGSSSTYVIGPVPGAVSYLWSTTGSGISVSGSGTSATVSTTSGFTSGSVCVIAVGVCGSPVSNSPQRCKSIVSGKLNTPGNITGDPRTGVCGQTYTYSIPALASATSYTWTLPAGATGSSSTNSITVTFSGSFTSGQICVYGNNACGAGFQRCVTVTGNPANPTGLTTTSNTPCIGTDILVSWNAAPGATSYDVLVPVGSTVLTGTPTTNTFAVINVGATGGVVGIRARSSCGNSGTATLAIAPVACRASGSLANDAVATRLELFPNPAKDRAQIRFEAPAHENVTLEAYDAAGRRVKGFSFTAEQGLNLQELDLAGMTPGMYFFVINGNELGMTRFTLIVE
ncbi:MAG: T9SS type A sorting domain-containing protein, partial [Bacteroidia bacterium]|nr:T9SS type A sorting domain-containing protein [Bacteroidia bacterium]